MNEHIEHTTTPPETGGIAPQPTQQELSEIAGGFSDTPVKKPMPLLGVIVIAFILLSVGGMYLWITTSQSQLQTVEVTIMDTEKKMGDDASDSAKVDDLSLLDYIFQGRFKEEFSSSNVTTPFDTQWKDRGLDFTMQSVHDLSVVSAAEYVLSPEYVGKRVVVVELDVVDTRLTGEPVEVKANTYLATRFEQTDTTAADWREVLIKPGEKKTVYVPFILDSHKVDYFILSGDLRNPFVSPIGKPAVTPVLEPTEE